VPFEVEEDVAVVGFGHELEPATPHGVVARLDHTDRGRPVGSVAGSHLQRCLSGQPLESLRLHGLHRVGATGEGLDRGDARTLERSPVRAPDAGDVDE
jgi:hypothetical protein